MGTRTRLTGTPAKASTLYFLFILKAFSELFIPSPDSIGIVPDVFNEPRGSNISSLATHSTTTAPSQLGKKTRAV